MSAMILSVFYPSPPNSMFPNARPSPISNAFHRFFPALSCQPKFRNNRALFSSCRAGNDKSKAIFESFSALKADVPWESEDIWSTFAAYMFTLHIPLSFGGLSFVAKALHQPILDPLTMVVSADVLQIVELFGALTLLHCTAKPGHQIFSFLYDNSYLKERNWIKATVLGIGFLVALVFVTSVVADGLTGQKNQWQDVNVPVVEEILSDGPLSRAASVFLLCFITPVLEETMYRGFLLSSLTKEMKWWQAVIISACVFSTAHFSFENSIQLFAIGCILGCVYCWSGILAAPFAVHCIYNLLILLATIST